MSLYKSYGTDQGRETSGVILELEDGVRFRLARAGGANVKFERRLMMLTKPYRRAIQSGTIDKKLSEKLLAQAYAEAVIMSWENVKGQDGQLLDFTVENAVKLMTDLPDLFKEIRETAEDFTLFREDVVETDAKNS